ncbi:MAG: hypothetical protein V4864_02070 [Pseudomonadota bacterium]
MKRQLRNHAAALFLLAPVAAALVAPGAEAATAQRATPAAPQVYSLALNADNGISPGSHLDITVEGSPGAQASVRLASTGITVPLRQVRGGVYRGGYTVRSADRIDPTAMLQARLTRGNQTTLRNFSYPASFQALAMGNAPQANAPQPAPVQPQVVTLRIERFAMLPAGNIEPGRELRFRLRGAPGANATLEIPGVVSGIAMQEVNPGVYEASYTVRQRDNPEALTTAVATLRAGNQWVTSRISQPVARDRQAPTISNLLPANGDRVAASGLTTVSGTFDDEGSRGIDPDSVRLRIGGRDVTDAAQISPHRFSYRSDLPPGRYTAEISARDVSGNAVTKTWTFDVVGGAVGAGPSGPLPLHLSSPANNATVDPNGGVYVQGRTVPWATVRVKVDAVPPVIGSRLGVALQLADQTVQADRDGYFSVNVAPRAAGIPGSRYEVSVTANQGPQTAESHVTLYQRG